MLVCGLVRTQREQQLLGSGGTEGKQLLSFPLGASEHNITLSVIQIFLWSGTNQSSFSYFR